MTSTRKSPDTLQPLARPQATIMLSRVAHSLYWMSRYIERAENVARLLDVNLQFVADFQSRTHDRPNAWASIILSSGEEELFKKHYAETDSNSVTEFLAFDLRNPGSILSCVYAARENARMVRDQISLEMWETINELHLFLKSQTTAAVWADGPQDFFSKINRASHLFQGLTASTYTRSEGWEYIEFGKYIERADKTTRILDVKYHILLPSATDVGGALDTAQWQAVLRSASALEAYRRYYVSEILAWKAAEFLIFSDSFPRSLHFCMVRVDDILRRILGESGTRTRSSAGRASRRLRANLESLTINDVVERGLHEFLVDVQSTLSGISDDVAKTTIFYAAESRIEEQQQQQQQSRHH
ncbi:MAG: hypothetical protein RL077_2533 [Verrucomicrobiota bacterium]|jgi:uncharacterized alpha-E superfamily protein